MKNKPLLICALAVLVMLLPGCTPATPTTSPEYSCDDFARQNHITTSISARTGGEFTVTLGANPTTGYQWEDAVISDTSVLTETNHQSLGPEDENLVGAPGKDVWTFKALKPGSATISIAYSRPWEGGEKGTWTFTANVTVK